MQFDEILIGSAMVGLCVIIHVGAIVVLLDVMRRCAKGWIAWRFYPGATAIMLIIVVGLLLAHTLEIWLWAVLYIYLGEFADMSRALYFSTVTFTTLGYGDVVLTDSWQLLSSLEAAGGILLFGLSTGASVAAMMAIIGAGNENKK
jgi:hypothetical protein